MDPVNNLGKAMEALRRQLAERAGKGGAGAAAASGGNTRRADSRPNVEARVMARLGELDPDAESFARRSTRIFLDELLGGEFGESAWAQADFQKMIDDIQDEWVASPQLVAGLRELAQRAPRNR